MTERPVGPREMARASGVSTDTLRHYERKGLLPGVTRTAAGYRRYANGTVARVLLIQRALVVGFSLADLTRVLRARDRGGAPCRSVRELVGHRLEELDRRIEELLALRHELRAVLAEWDARLANAAAGEPLRLLETLGSTVVIERVRQKPKGRRPIRGPAVQALREE